MPKFRALSLFVLAGACLSILIGLARRPSTAVAAPLEGDPVKETVEPTR